MAQHHVGVLDHEVLRPVGDDRAVVEPRPLVALERDELLRPDTEHLAEGARVPPARPSGLVHDARRVGDEQGRAAVDHGADARRRRRVDDEERRQDDHVVAGEVGVERHHVRGDLPGARTRCATPGPRAPYRSPRCGFSPVCSAQPEASSTTIATRGGFDGCALHRSERLERTAEGAHLTPARVRVPACGTIAEWNCSAPAVDARHWKNSAPSDPRATCASEFRTSSPGSFARLRCCQLGPRSSAP